jgi:hypothetical protein
MYLPKGSIKQGLKKKQNISDNPGVDALISEMRTLQSGNDIQKIESLKRIAQNIYIGGNTLEQVILFNTVHSKRF